MKETLLVAIGAAFGGSARYLLSAFILQHTLDQKFPYHTFAVNILGCLVAGILIGCAERYDLLDTQTRLFVITGVLGGFTTFSAFGLEMFQMLRRGDILLAIGYSTFSLLLSVLVLTLAFLFITGKR